MRLRVWIVLVVTATFGGGVVDLARAEPAAPRLLTSASQVRAEEDERVWRLRGGLDVRYDDNILFLSSGTIRRFDSGTSSRPFRIGSVGAFVARPWAEIRALVGQSELGVGAGVSVYDGNAVKDSQSFTVFLNREYARTSALRFTYAWMDDRYVGELTDPDTRLWSSVFYDVHELETRYRRRLSRTVIVAPRLSLKLRLYNQGLDNPRTRAGIETNVPIFIRTSRWLRFDLELHGEYLQALSPRDDFDPTGLRYSLEAGVALSPFGSDFQLAPSVRYGQQRYTTSNSQDATYYARTDVFVRLQVVLRYNISAGVSLRATYVHDEAEAGVTSTAAENTSYTRNVSSLGLTFAF